MSCHALLPWHWSCPRFFKLIIHNNLRYLFIHWQPNLKCTWFLFEKSDHHMFRLISRLCCDFLFGLSIRVFTFSLWPKEDRLFFFFFLVTSIRHKINLSIIFKYYLLVHFESHVASAVCLFRIPISCCLVATFLPGVLTTSIFVTAQSLYFHHNATIQN